MRDPDRRWVALAVGALTALGFALRLAGFDQGLFGDELSTYAAATLADGPADVVDLVVSDEDLIDTGRYVVELTPPLSFLVAWLTAQIGDATETVRLGSLAAGTATIPLVYLLGARTVGRSAALVGAALAALSPFLIFYSDEARGYALGAALVLFAALALVRAVETRAAGWWVAYALASVAALYTHYTVAFALLGIAAWALWAYRDAWRPLLVANLAAALAFVPWLPEFFDDGASGWNQLPRLHPFTLDNVTHDLLEWGLQSPLVDFGVVPGALAGTVIAAGLVVAAVALGVGGARDRPADPGRVRHGLALVIVLGVALPLGLILWSAVGTTILDSRNMLASWPGLALAAGALLAAPRPPLGWIATGLVVAGLGIAVVRNLDPDAQRPDYREAAEFVRDHAEPGDTVIDVPVFGQDPMSPVANHVAVYLPEFDVDQPEDVPGAMSDADGDRVVVVTWVARDANGEPVAPAVAPEAPAGMELAESGVFDGAFDVAVFVYERGGASS